MHPGLEALHAGNVRMALDPQEQERLGVDVLEVPVSKVCAWLLAQESVASHMRAQWLLAHQQHRAKLLAHSTAPRLPRWCTQPMHQAWLQSEAFRACTSTQPHVAALWFLDQLASPSWLDFAKVEAPLSERPSSSVVPPQVRRDWLAKAVWFDRSSLTLGQALERALSRTPDWELLGQLFARDPKRPL